MIAILSNSLLQDTEPQHNNWADYLCGRWQDDTDADEFAEKLRSARTMNRDVASLFD